MYPGSEIYGGLANTWDYGNLGVEDSDPLFYTVRDDYFFDYRVRPDSPAIGASIPTLSTGLSPIDYYGITRTSDLGAYTFTAPEE